MQALAVLISLLGVVPAVINPQVRVATVTGCVTDTSGYPLPGATVTLRPSDTVLHRLSDAKGCFVFEGVPPGVAAVEACLAGFTTDRHEKLDIPAGRETRVDFVVGVTHRSKLDWVLPPTYAQFLKSADAVVHVRITNTYESMPECGRTEMGWFHAAKVLHAVRTPTGLGPTITFFQECWLQEQRPYPRKTELVLALRATSSGYVRVAGPHAVLVVKNGKVHGSLPTLFGTSYEGMSFDAYLADLGRLLK